MILERLEPDAVDRQPAHILRARACDASLSSTSADFDRMVSVEVVQLQPRPPCAGVWLQAPEPRLVMLEGEDGEREAGLELLRSLSRAERALRRSKQESPSE